MKYSDKKIDKTKRVLDGFEKGERWKTDKFLSSKKKEIKNFVEKGLWD